MSSYVIARDQFYQTFPRISTANDKHWGEKAWVHYYRRYDFAAACEQSLKVRMHRGKQSYWDIGACRKDNS